MAATTRPSVAPREERPGPVHLELPEDIAGEDMTQDVPLVPAHPVELPLADARALDRAAELLAQAQAKPKENKYTDLKSASRWEYDFVLASEMGTAKFVGFLNDREARGWEFVGEVTLQHQGKDGPYWLFRRAAGAAKAAASNAYRRSVEELYKLESDRAEQERHRALEALKAAEPYKGDDGYN